MADGKGDNPRPDQSPPGGPQRLVCPVCLTWAPKHCLSTGCGWRKCSNHYQKYVTFSATGRQRWFYEVRNG